MEALTLASWDGCAAVVAADRLDDRWEPGVPAAPVGGVLLWQPDLPEPDGFVSNVLLRFVVDPEEVEVADDPASMWSAVAVARRLVAGEVREQVTVGLVGVRPIVQLVRWYTDPAAKERRLLQAVGSVPVDRFGSVEEPLRRLLDAVEVAR